MSKKQIHNLIILDESGSMDSVKETTIQGLNETVQTIKGLSEKYPNQEHYITFVTFNGLGKKLVHFADKVSELNEIDGRNYNPSSLTPLFDAMGFSINKLRNYLEGKTDYDVLVTILTDGEENASKEYSGKDIKKLVEELGEGNWTFTYMGTDHDVEKMADRMSIQNRMRFSKNDEDLKKMLSMDRSSRDVYYQKVNYNDRSRKRDYFRERDQANKKDDKKS